MDKKIFTQLILLSLCFYSISTLAAPPKNLSYPTAAPSAEEIADQVYFVNHFYSVKNISFERDGKGHVTTLILRKKGEKPHITAFRRYLNNAYGDGPIKARDLALFSSGKLEGVRLLLTQYTDESKRQSYKIWLPSLKKLSYFSEPDQDAAWRDSDFTYGDVYLRTPEDEHHTLLEETTFNDCLGSMVFDLKSLSNTRLIKNIPHQQCEHRGKEIFKLKSATKFKNWWYDERISFIDKQTFADYRIDYYKNGKLVKRIDKDWTAMSDQLMDLTQDARSVFWRYWYGKNYLTGHETMVHTWPEVVRWNQDMKEELWTEKSLRGN